MSDEWFFDSGRRRSARRGWLSVVILILVVANIGVLAFFVFDFNLQVSKLNREVKTLQFQLASANNEIASLRDEVKMLRLGNESRSLRLTQIYNRTRKSVVLISIRTPFGRGQGSGFVYDDEGRIITNNHVVEDAVEITVTFIDGTIAVSYTHLTLPTKA